MLSFSTFCLFIFEEISTFHLLSYIDEVVFVYEDIAQDHSEPQRNHCIGKGDEIKLLLSRRSKIAVLLLGMAILPKKRSQKPESTEYRYLTTWPKTKMSLRSGGKWMISNHISTFPTLKSGKMLWKESRTVKFSTVSLCYHPFPWHRTKKATNVLKIWKKSDISLQCQFITVQEIVSKIS